MAHNSLNRCDKMSLPGFNELFQSLEQPAATPEVLKIIATSSGKYNLVDVPQLTKQANSRQVFAIATSDRDLDAIALTYPNAYSYRRRPLRHDP